MRKLEYRGMWWLPENPRKIAGTLTFSARRGGTLDLAGSLAEEAKMEPKLEMLQPKIILGSSIDETSLTLYDCFETERRKSLPSGLETSKFYANYLFTGAHFTSPEFIKFTSLSVHYRYFDEWMRTSGFEIRDPKGESGVIVEYRLPHSIEMPVEENWGVVLEFLFTPPAHTRIQTQATIKQKGYVTIESNEQKSLSEYMELVYGIRDFLTLAAMEPVYPLEMTGHIKANGQRVHPLVRVYHRRFEVPGRGGPFYPEWDMLFSLEDVHDKAHTIIRDWFARRELLRPVCDLYFGTLFNPAAYLQQQFLSLAQALESYHRVRMQNLELPEQEHEKRIKRILDGTGQEDRKWLQEKLAWSNEVTFRRRMNELLQEFSEVVPEVIGDPDRLASQVVDTRNYLTHYDQRLKHLAADNERLIEITERLKVVIHACLTTEAGFDKNMTRFLFRRNRRYKQMAASFRARDRMRS